MYLPLYNNIICGGHIIVSRLEARESYPRAINKALHMPGTRGLSGSIPGLIHYMCITHFHSRCVYELHQIRDRDRSGGPVNF